MALPLNDERWSSRASTYRRLQVQAAQEWIDLFRAGPRLPLCGPGVLETAGDDANCVLKVNTPPMAASPGGAAAEIEKSPTMERSPATRRSA